MGGRSTARINARVESTVDSWRQCLKTFCSAGPTTPPPISSTPISRAASATRSHSPITQRSLTYAQLQARSCRFAAALQALGSARGKSRHPRCSTTPSIILSLFGARSAPVSSRFPVNTLLTAEQYAYLFADSRAAAAVVAAPLARDPAVVCAIAFRACARSSWSARAPRTRPRCGTCCSSRTCWRRREPTPFTAPTMSDEVAFWMYTSGSTGDPKAVRHVHTSLMATATLMGQGVIGLREDDVVFSAAKLSFSYGLGNAVSFPMSVGASAVLLPDRPTPQAVLATLRRHRPTIFYGGAVAVRGAARASRYRARRGLGPRCGCAFRRARRCPRISANAGARWSASTSSTASARPRCCRRS